MCQDCNENSITLPIGPPGPLGPNSGKPIIAISLTADNDSDYRTVSSPSFTTLCTIQYPGTTEIGNTPTKVNIVYSVLSGSSTVRIVDNNSNLIATTTVTANSKSIISTNIIASQSILTNSVYWEVQAQASVAIKIYSVTIY